MSEFWVASDPPGMPDMVKWCEAEVERACMDMWSNVTVMGWLNDGKLTADPYAGGDWELDTEGRGPTIASLVASALETHVSAAHDPVRRHFDDESRPMVLAAIDELQGVIDKYRDLCRASPF